MFLNLFSMYFDFEGQVLLIEYYAKDENYPPVILTFKEFVGLLEDS